MATKTFSSSIMREGLYHKIGLLLVILLGVLVDYAQGWLELGMSVPVAGAVCAYIVIMEIGSSLENICKINPDLMPDKLTALFGVKGSEDDE
ncbi:MAG: phage holin family protein [Clostridiales bacterium]|nr:phage holin family protein [Clostridiales bacterium]